MATNRLTPVDFNQRIQIGTVKTVQNPINGTRDCLKTKNSGII